MSRSITRRQFLVDGGKVAAGATLAGSLLAACGPGAASTVAKNYDLQYWALGYQTGTASGKLTDAALSGFHKANPKITATVTSYTGDQAGFTKLTQALQTPGTVDVFRVSADELPLLVKQGLVAPIDSYLSASDKADIFPNILDALKINGKIYAWPLWVPPVGMYINLDIFQEKGVQPPSDDWTYDDFVKIAQQLTFTRANGDKVYGFTGQIDPGVLNVWPFIMGDGGRLFSADHKKYTLNSAQGISGLQKLVDLSQKYKVTPPDFGSQAADEIKTGFSQKKVFAMYCAPSGDSVGYAASNLNFDVKPMPIGAMGKHFTTGGIGLFAVTQMTDTGRLAAAMDLGRYLTSGQVSQDVPGYYLAPGARKSAVVKAPITKFVPLVGSTYLIPEIASWPQIRLTVNPQIQNAVLGKVSASDALNQVADEINSDLSS